MGVGDKRRGNVIAWDQPLGTPIMRYRTTCHCTAVSIEMDRPIRQMTECNCSICRRYGALWAYQQRKAIRVFDTDKCLQSYRWGKESIEYFHCTRCGCVTHYEQTDKREDGSDMSAVNMRLIDDPTRIAHLPIRLLDGADTWKVLGRRVEPGVFKSPN